MLIAISMVLWCAEMTCSQREPEQMEESRLKFVRYSCSFHVPAIRYTIVIRLPLPHSREFCSIENRKIESVMIDCQRDTSLQNPAVNNVWFS